MKLALPQRAIKAFINGWNLFLPPKFYWKGSGEIRLGHMAHPFETISINNTDAALGAYSYSRSLLFNTLAGNYCSFADNIHFSPLTHPIHRLTTHPAFNESSAWPEACKPSHFPSEGPITIGHDVWIGMRAIIMSGVKIGNGAVIAANAVVTKDVPPFAIVGGIPAKVIRYRFEPEVIKAIEDSHWWDYDIPAMPLSSPPNWDDPLATLACFKAAIARGDLKLLPKPQKLDLRTLRAFQRKHLFAITWTRHLHLIRLFGLILYIKALPLDWE